MDQNEICVWAGSAVPVINIEADVEYRSLENPAVSLTDPTAWNEAFGWGSGSDAGESVTAEKSLTCPAVWQAVGMISGDVSKLPLEVFTRNGKDRDADPSHQAYRLISPYSLANPETTALILWRRMLVHALLWPRGYVWIDRRGDGTPVGLYNLLPDRTGMERIRGRLWVVTEVDGSIHALPLDDVLVLENLSIDSLSAFGPVAMARHNIGLQLAKRRFASKFFANGLHAGGVLQVPPGASDKARRKVEEGIENKRFAADNAFKTLVLRDGFKWHTTMVNPEQAEMSEVEEQEVRNVARFYRMSPSRLGVKESISYNSEEAARRAYHDETLSYWLTGIKAETNVKLLTTQQRETRTHFIDYNVHALNWADTNTVMSVGTQGVQWGIFNRDEVRRWFNYNAIPGGEGSKHFTPLNMGVAGESPADDDQQPARSAVRVLCADAVRRMVSRLAVHARRAAKAGRLNAWLETFADEHREALAGIWSPAAVVAASLGLASDRDVVDSLCTALAGDLRNLPDDDLAAVDARCDEYLDRAGEIFADQFLQKEN